MLTVIGCGNSNRSDDGVGVFVARKLRERFGNPQEGKLRIFDAGSDGMAVMFKARGSESLVIVDASRTGSEPGAVFEVPGEELEGEPAHALNLHDFRWDHALYAGRKIFKEEFPQDVTVFLIEAGSLELGVTLTAEAERAANVVIDKIAARIARYGA